MSEQVNLHVINLAEYEAPVIVENNREEWVEYGEDNMYYDWLIERYHGSTTNNSIINRMSKLIYGRGLSALNANKRPNEYAAMMALFTPETLRATISSLKMLGDTYLQCIYNSKHTKIEKVSYITADRIRVEKCGDNGDIVGYFYSDNWEDVKKYPPKRIPAFGTSKENIELLRIKPFTVGLKYYSPVDYQGALPYAVLEEEVASYLITEVTSSFSGTKVINFNNGIPTEEQQNIIKSKVMSKLTGSNGEKVIVAFNNNAESKTTVDDIPLNDAPEHYAYLSEEARSKLLAGHGVTSPFLVGVHTENQGFSSNADEIEVAAKYFYNTSIKPFQDLIIEAIEQILTFNGVGGLDLYFKRLNLLEDIEQKEQAEEAQAESYGFSLSSQLQDLIDEYGEDESEEWELIDVREVNYEDEERLDAELAEMEAKLQEKPKSLLSKIWEFATGTASPNRESEQDKEVDGFYFKVRYKYAGNESPQRDFCRQMMRASKLYRKEDIMKMSSQGINKNHGHKGQPYDLFLYKGGVSCHHKWERRTYVSASKRASIGSAKTKEIDQMKAASFGYVVNNDPKVGQMPKDMPNRGHHPDYGK